MLSKSTAGFAIRVSVEKVKNPIQYQGICL